MEHVSVSRERLTDTLFVMRIGLVIKISRFVKTESITPKKHNPYDYAVDGGIW